MKLDVTWHPAIELTDGSDEDLIYAVEDIQDWREVPGVYMFCRMYGESLNPIYIGRSKNVGVRIEQHLNTTKMMRAIQNASSGKRVVVIGELQRKSGLNIQSGLKVLEKTLIEFALAEGYELTNKAGTKTPTHEIEFKGFNTAKQFSGSRMYAKASR